MGGTLAGGQWAGTAASCADQFAGQLEAPSILVTELEGRRQACSPEVAHRKTWCSTVSGNSCSAVSNSLRFMMCRCAKPPTI